MSHAYRPAPTSHRQGGPRSGHPVKWAAFAVHLVTDIAAGFVGLWIVLVLFGADEDSLFVRYVRDMAYWIAGWTLHIATVENASLRLLLNYVPPALVYLALGHGAAAKIRRTDPAEAGRGGEGPSPSAARPAVPPSVRPAVPPPVPRDAAGPARESG